MQRIQVTARNLQKILPLNLKKIKAIVRNVLAHTNDTACGEVTVLFVDDKRIRAYNRIYAGKDYATDVLAFDSGNEPGVLVADIVISVETAVSNARRYHTAAWYEVCLYVVHGLLHLVGYDDRGAAQRKIMHKKSVHLLHSVHVHP